MWDSMRSTGKPFYAFMTLSAKKFDLTEIHSTVLFKSLGL